MRTRDDLPLPEVPSTARKQVAAERVDHLVDAALAAEEQIELFPAEGPEAGIGNALRAEDGAHVGQVQHHAIENFGGEPATTVDFLDLAAARCRPAASAAAGS